MRRNTAPVCNENCFNCPYEDCVRDDLTAKTYRDLDTVDKEILNPKTLKQKQLAAKKREYYEANKEQLAAKKREYYEANKEQIAAKMREYREANKEQLAAKMREYREANRAAYNAYHRAYYKKRKEQHHEN